MKQAEILRRIRGVRRFAWLPTFMADGELLWLESYVAYYHGLRHPTGDFHLCPRYPGIESDNYRERHGKPVECIVLFDHDGEYLSLPQYVKVLT